MKEFRDKQIKDLDIEYDSYKVTVLLPQCTLAFIHESQ